MDEPNYQIEVDQCDELTWSQLLDEFKDASIYQTWAYGAIRWGGRNVSHLVLKRDGKAIAISQLRIVRPAGLKYGMAHLRWGPICHRRDDELDPRVIERMAGALYDEYVVKRGLFLRVLPRAFLETDRGRKFQDSFSKYEVQSFAPGESYRTIVLDLAPSLEVLRKNLDQKWRNQLNRAEKNGLTVIEDGTVDRFGTFVRLYQEMMSRKRFDGASDVVGFERVQPNLPRNQKMKVLICEQQGVPVAGLVGTAVGDMGIYLLGATNELGMKSKGAYLLQWTMIRWLKENGACWYNLGGINPEKNPGVYHFKAGLSGNDSLYVRPMVACESIGSGVLAKAANLLRGKGREVFAKLLRRR